MMILAIAFGVIFFVGAIICIDGDVDAAKAHNAALLANERRIEKIVVDKVSQKML